MNVTEYSQVEESESTSEYPFNLIREEFQENDIALGNERIPDVIEKVSFTNY